MGIRIDRVYTRSGDDGFTGLVGGRRVEKICARVEAYGELDEVNAWLGMAKEQLTSDTAELQPVLELLQQELFDLGSELATDPRDTYPEMWRVAARHVVHLEKLCDRFSENLEQLTSFVLPGGSPLAASLHVARTVARRAERSVLHLRQHPDGREESVPAESAVSKEAIQYLNRLSDLLFILARWSLKIQAKDAPLWVKEQDR